MPTRVREMIKNNKEDCNYTLQIPMMVVEKIAVIFFRSSIQNQGSPLTLYKRILLAHCMHDSVSLRGYT